MSGREIITCRADLIGATELEEEGEETELAGIEGRL